MSSLSNCSFIILFILTGCTPCFSAVNPSPVFRHFTTEDGLPSSEVYHVMQDSKGYLWFSTDNGVSRYDGYKFLTLGLEDGLPDMTILRCFEDEWGRIWFVSLSCQLSYYHENKIVQYPYNHLLTQNLTHTVFTDFYVDSSSRVYLGVVDAGVITIDKLGNKQVHYGSKQETISGIVIIDGDYPFFVSSKKELGGKSRDFWLLDSINSTKRITLNRPDGFKSLKGLQRKNNQFLIAAGDQLLEPNSQNQISIKNFGKPIIWLTEDSRGSLWISTYLNGVFFYPDGSVDGNNFHQFLRGLSVSSITEDHENGIWLTTLENGVYYLPSTNTFTIDDEFNSNRKISDMEFDAQGNLILGFNNRTITTLFKQKSQTISFEEDHQTSTEVKIKFDPTTGNLLASGSYGIYSINSGQSIKLCCDSIYPRISVKDVMVSSDSGLWFASTWGIVKLKSSRIKYHSLTNPTTIKRIDCIEEDHLGNIWFGSMDGLWKITSDTFSYFGNHHPLLTTRINDIAFYKNQMLIGTKGAGLVVWDNESIYSIKVENGLAGNTVKDILVDSLVWIGTSSGISKLTNRGKRWIITNYNTYDGLCSDEILKIISHDNFIYAATPKGISFFPSSFESTSNPPIVRITGIEKVEEITSPINKFSIEYNQSFTIHYIGFSYKARENITYRYKLEGLDTAWVYTGNINVRYSGLREGDYRFLLQAKTEKSQWSMIIHSPQIQILPPWWRTWWGYTSFSTTGLLLIFGIYRGQLKRVKKREAEKTRLTQNIAESKLQALRAQMNPHFTFNTLNSINHYILENEKDEAQKYLTKFASLLRKILEHSDKDRVPLTQEIENLKIYIELEQLRFERPFNYTIHIHNTVYRDFVQIPPMIVQPFVENAINHGLFGLKDRLGLLSLDFKISNNYLICEVEDNGIGRQQAAKHKKKIGFTNKQSKAIEINSQRLQLLDLLQKNIGINFEDLKDEFGNACGTRVKIKIPLT